MDEPAVVAHPFPETPVHALGQIVRERIVVDGRTFWITRPDASNQLMEHPVIKANYAVNEYLPFWTELWPAARMLAKVVLRESWLPGTRALEIGCGLGLPGIAALACGLEMTFSDLDATALRFAGDNARLNGFKKFQLLPLDWHRPPQGLQVPVILASDLIYELRAINPLVALIQQVLAPGGICFLVDQNRLPSYNLTDALIGEGLPFTTQVVRAGEPGGRRVKGTLYRIRQSG
jgi:predicted nicotinamide N-methyase